MANGEIIELLKRYILLLNAEGILVNRAFLFGSYSNDTATDSSDIDVMIVSDKYDETDDLAVGKAWKLTRLISSRIEPYLIGTKRFLDDNSSPLVSMVKLNGIEIVLKN
jgi:predicted nucleotidyltransferase